MKIPQNIFIVAVAATALWGVGCAKKHPVAKSAPPPAPVAAPQRTEAPPTVARSTPRENTAPEATPRNYPDAATRARIDQLLARIEDAYFDYNKASLRPDAQKALQADSTELRDILKDYPDYKLTIEGHCDERGSDQYNMALGEKRAQTAKDYLVQIGIPSNQLGVISYGRQRPVCEARTEACWQKNRRIHIVAQNNQPQ